MTREAERTLHSLSTVYQLDVAEDQYDVYVIDNGSAKPLKNPDMSRFGNNFYYQHIPDAHPSPAFSINKTLAATSTEYVAVLIDGAHIITPGVLKYAFKCFDAYDNPFVVTRYCFLGPGQQNRTVAEGYNQEAEDQLMEKINWPEDGYRLFEIGELIGAHKPGWFQPVFESNCFFIKRETYDKLAGYEERFNFPGGGYANIDFYTRATNVKGVNTVCLFGEASFHQVHGGTTTNAGLIRQEKLLAQYRKQYNAIRGKEFKVRPFAMEYLGYLPNNPENYIKPISAKSLLNPGQNTSNQEKDPPEKKLIKISKTGKKQERSKPILITGCQRSGTTLLGLMLDSHTHISMVDETEYATNSPDDYLLKPDYPPAICFKLPMFVHSHKVIETCDKVKVLWCIRDPRDVVTSMVKLKMKGRNHEMKKVNVSWAVHPRGANFEIQPVLEKLDENTRKELDDYMKTFWEVLDKDVDERKYKDAVLLATLCWRMKNELPAIYKRKGIDLKIVQYEEIILNPKRTSKEILEFLELPWDQNVLSHHKFHTGISVGNTDNTRPIDSENRNKWEGFLTNKHLKMIEELCEPIYDKFKNENGNRKNQI
jgi:hypothetical protein